LKNLVPAASSEQGTPIAHNVDTLAKSLAVGKQEAVEVRGVAVQRQERPGMRDECERMTPRQAREKAFPSRPLTSGQARR
jgi:hypothetical protein